MTRAATDANAVLEYSILYADTVVTSNTIESVQAPGGVYFSRSNVTGLVLEITPLNNLSGVSRS